jgi:hypothetical protein
VTPSFPPSLGRRIPPPDSRLPDDYRANVFPALTGVKVAAQTDRATTLLRIAGMTKILSLLIVGMMIAHIIKPLGLPGLKKRSDFWKLAIVALAAVSLTVLLSHGN